MNEEAFVQSRTADWQRLVFLVDKAEQGLAKLSALEIREIIRLYRKASTDLATVQAKSTNYSLRSNLNGLVGRAYSVLYRAPSQSLGIIVAQALAAAADTVRRRYAYVLASIAIFFGAAFFAFFTMRLVPQSREAFLPPGMEVNFEGWKKGKFEERTGGQGVAMTGFYASNNPRVSIIAGAVGAGSFGFLSVVMDYQNGAIIGTLAHEMDSVGKLPFLLSSIAPHGVPELSGIWMACAAGLLYGSALVNPGRRKRSDALRAVNKDAITLLAISIALTLIAAPIEGFFSFSPTVPQSLKVVVALLETIGWLSFWTFYGREGNPELAK